MTARTANAQARRASARARLQSIADKLTATLADPGPWANVRLKRSEARYLTDVCRAALRDAPDPLQIGKAVGRQSAGDAGFSEALLVHARRRERGTLRAACEAVGRELNRDGGKSGAVEKNYKAHRKAIEAAERFYAALSGGEPFDSADLRTILGGESRGT